MNRIFMGSGDKFTRVCRAVSVRKCTLILVKYVKQYYHHQQQQQLILKEQQQEINT